jgi:DNA-binding transcriptional ArsR family regulator
MTEEKPTYYSIIPAGVRYDEELKPNEKLLYSEITALTNKNGECWASNSYFSNLYKVDQATISRWISNLKQKGYIDLSLIYKANTKQIEKRVLTIKSIGIDKIINRGIDEKVKDNNTSINNTSINKEKIYIKKNFIKPTLEEVKQYCEERNNGIDAEYFIDFYESKGWQVGKTKMKDWKASIRTWERNKKQQIENKPKTKREQMNELFERMMKEDD